MIYRKPELLTPASARNMGDIGNLSDAVAAVSYVFTGTPCPHCQGQPCWTQ